MDAQQEHDLLMEERGEFKPAKGSKKRLEALLARKNGPSLEPVPSIGYDPIASCMAQNPGLTRERAEELAANLGF